MIRDSLESFAEWAYERTLDLNVPASFGKAGYVMRARFFEPGALDVDMSGKACAITGANAGLGYAASRALAERGASVYMLCRSEERGRAARERLRGEVEGGELHLEIVDVSSRESIDAFAERWGDRPLDVLVNNAGILPDERSENAEGIEMTWATNILGPYRLIRALTRNLEAAGGRIVLVSSGGMYLKKLDIGDWNETAKKQFDGTRAYANTKRAMVILAEELAPELAERGISINAMHPGWVDTGGVRTSLPRFHRLTKSFLREWHQGADTIVWLAVSEEAGEHTGEFFFDREVRHTHVLPFTTASEADRRRLMDLLAEQA